MLVGLLNFILFSQVDAINGKCRILALGGGSDRGAYEAGAIIGLINNLPAGEATWDVVTGSGVGAINGMFVAQYAQGSESSAAAALQSFWSSFTPAKFYTNWIGGLLTGLLAKSGLYDTTPMKNLISATSKTAPKRFLGVGATDLVSSSYVFFNSSGTSLSNLNTGTLAAAAEYFFFPYVSYSTYKLTTGSIRYVVDIYNGFNACNQLGYANNQIDIDIVLGSGKNIQVIDASGLTSIQVLLRSQVITAYQDSALMIETAQENFKNVNFRSVIYPSGNLNSPLTPYSYSASDLANQLAMGQADAKAAVSTVHAENQ